MTNVIVHRIRRQRWSVRASSVDEAMHWRQQLNQGSQSDLLPLFEQVLDAAGFGEQIVHIPRLELSVRAHSMAQLSEQLPALLAQALADELRQRPTVGAVKPQSSGGSAASDELAFEPWLQYLRDGSVPWFCAQADREQLRAGLPPSPARQRQLLRLALAEVTTQPQVLLLFWRWLQALADADWQSEIISLLNESGSSLAAAAEQLSNVIAEQPQLSRYQRLQWLSLILMRLWRLELADVALTRLLTELSTVATQTPASAAERWSIFLLWLADTIVVPPIAEVRSSEPPVHVADSVASRAAIASQAPMSLALKPHTDLLQLARAQPAFPSDVLASSDTVTVTVAHAGLLLLHPFLPQLFVSTGIVSERSATLPLAQLPRASALLHFLATGDEQLAEYELGFIKVLLGLAVDAPLPIAEGLLIESDKAEVDALLTAVIQHWTALKNTSITGLRLSFLQRHGLLRAEPDGWRVHIEREAFDVLLDFLPWGIGVIKLPWMTDAIHTVW